MKKGTRNNIVLWSTISFVILFFALSVLWTIMSDRDEQNRVTMLKDITADKIIEVRKLVRNVLEDFSIGRVQFKGINEKYIRTGPGMKYKSDDTGWLPETDPLYVLEEKDDWIRFRVTEKDLGWSAWIRKDLTTSIQNLR